MNNVIRLFLAMLWTCASMITLSAQIGIESSQTPDHASQVNHVLQHLSMAPVTSGVLLDRTIPFFDASSTGAPAASDSVYMSTRVLDVLYRNIYAARLPFSTLASPESAYADRVIAYTPSPTIPILLSALQYHRLDTNAVADGKLRINNGQLYYMPGNLCQPISQILQL